MNQRHFLLKGTFFLTSAGIISKLAGFYYKIFLSRTIGAHQIGLFQMTVPVFMLCLSVSCGGLQMAVSRYTALFHAEGQRKSASRILLCALSSSLLLSLLSVILLWKHAGWIACRFLMEPKCEPLIRLSALSLPFTAIHSCIYGYYIGSKNALIPALSQITEQVIRVLTVYYIYLHSVRRQIPLNARLMAKGLFAGEAASAFFCLVTLLYFNMKHRKTDDSSEKYRITCRSAEKKLLSMAFPISATRILLCLFQTIEAALLPQKLQQSGLSPASALSFYGIVTGMAMPFLLFPTAITGALSSLLLPEISAAQTLKQSRQLSAKVQAGFYTSLLLGYYFMSIFFLFGPRIGDLLFRNSMAGTFIRSLSILAPSLYLSTTLTGILHGLGKTAVVSFCSIAGIFLRILLMNWLVPLSGMPAFLFLCIILQSITCFLMYLSLKKSTGYIPDIFSTITIPLLICFMSGLISYGISICFQYIQFPELFTLILACTFFTVLFCLGAKKYLLPRIKNVFG